MLDELLDGGQVGQALRVLDEVEQGDQRVGLAAAVGQFQLADGLVVLAREAVDHVLGQLAEVVGREGQREELGGGAVDGRAPVHHHVVEVGGELREGQLARADVGAELDDLVPGLPGELAHGAAFLDDG